nr:uncharacterized protein LOC128682912 [Plodia interpunctella]
MFSYVCSVISLLTILVYGTHAQGNEIEEEDLTRYYKENDYKPPLFGSNSYDPIKEIFHPPKHHKHEQSNSATVYAASTKVSTSTHETQDVQEGQTGSIGADSTVHEVKYTSTSHSPNVQSQEQETENKAYFRNQASKPHGALRQSNQLVDSKQPEKQYKNKIDINTTKLKRPSLRNRKKTVNILALKQTTKA